MLIRLIKFAAVFRPMFYVSRNMTDYEPSDLYPDWPLSDTDKKTALTRWKDWMMALESGVIKMEEPMFPKERLDIIMNEIQRLKEELGDEAESY
ncbi:unnamed protein product [Nezara viridula]|uniref:Uncharacterized protein n=1 Tax=Nezara viridula TaxID=85310 RepID=A0A9P0HU50_NEZVI|nr:unnamed protein product [Nezara viridula]